MEALTGWPLAKLSAHDKNRGPQVNFDRPELSPCVQEIAGVEARQEAIALIRRGAERLARRPNADEEDFEPCEMDRWREAKHVARQQAEARNREAIRRGTKHYARPNEGP